MCACFSKFMWTCPWCMYPEFCIGNDSRPSYGIPRFFQDKKKDQFMSVRIQQGGIYMIRGGLDQCFVQVSVSLSIQIYSVS